MVPGWHPRAASRKTACTCPMNGQCIYLAHVPVDVCESFFCACTSISGYLDKILIRIWPLYVILAAYLFRPFLQLFGNIFRHGNPRLHVLEAKGFTNLHHLHQNRNCLHNHGPPFTLFRRCRNYGHIMCAHAHAASSRQWPKGSPSSSSSAPPKSVTGLRRDPGGDASSSGCPQRMAESHYGWSR